MGREVRGMAHCRLVAGAGRVLSRTRSKKKKAMGSALTHFPVREMRMRLLHPPRATYFPQILVIFCVCVDAPASNHCPLNPDAASRRASLPPAEIVRPVLIAAATSLFAARGFRGTRPKKSPKPPASVKRCSSNTFPLNARSTAQFSAEKANLSALVEPSTTSRASGTTSESLH